MVKAKIDWVVKKRAHLMTRTITVGLFFFASAAMSFAQTPCEHLKTLSLPNVTITVAETLLAGPLTVAETLFAGQYQAPGNASPVPVFLPNRCRVTAVLAPSSDSHIEMELWLPMENWNGKFEAIGNGGWAGDIRTVDNGNHNVADTMEFAFKQGYAVAGNDTGHRGGGQFALDHPEKLVDFAYRAAHETAVASKAVISAFYGRGPRFSYWNGCSSGGRQGLVEAQRYPEDFDGIVAGAPANYWTHTVSNLIWYSRTNGKDQPGNIPVDKLVLLHEAVVRACDELDGSKDGLLENPTRCTFDPQILECKSGEGPTCLTRAQVEAAHKMYSGAVNSQTNQQIFPGLALGSELAWDRYSAPSSAPIGIQHFRFIVFKDGRWDYRELNFDTDVALADSIDKGLLNATDPNLQPFFAHGGKLIQYHGWSDDGISPLSSLNYYNSVLERLGGAIKVDDSYRLFMVPGMLHCGGESPTLFNPMSALERWRESNVAPGQMISPHVTSGVVDSVHLVCPYPQEAVYNGTGSVNDAANFSCKVHPKN
jgi:feruloyl esterase